MIIKIKMESVKKMSLEIRKLSKIIFVIMIIVGGALPLNHLIFSLGQNLILRVAMEQSVQN